MTILMDLFKATAFFTIGLVMAAILIQAAISDDRRAWENKHG